VLIIRTRTHELKSTCVGDFDGSVFFLVLLPYEAQIASCRGQQDFEVRLRCGHEPAARRGELYGCANQRVSGALVSVCTQQRDDLEKFAATVVFPVMLDVPASPDP
jgi:hypothetical protein